METIRHACWLFIEGETKVTKQIPDTNLFVHALREDASKVKDPGIVTHCNVTQMVNRPDIYQPGFVRLTSGYCSGCRSNVTVLVNSNPENTITADMSWDAIKATMIEPPATDSINVRIYFKGIT